jgi:hypothetical protein
MVAVDQARRGGSTLEDDIDDNALVTNREVFERVCQDAERMCPREKFFKAAELFALLS